jgi:hypothetical protein
VLTVIGIVLALLSVLGGYLRWELLDTDTFEERTGELIENDAIRDQVAFTLVDQLYGNVDVEAALAERLPADLQGLAAPLAGASRQVAQNGAVRLLERPRVQAVWQASVVAAHRQLIDVLEGGGEVVSTEGGAVVLDLRPLVIQVGEQVAIVGRLAERLPDDTGKIEILEADQLETAQDAAQLLKILGTFLWLVALALFALAVWLVRGRRRLELRAIAIGLLVVGLAVLVVRRLAGSYIVDALAAEESTREAADSAWSILTGRLRASGVTLVLIGIVVLLGVWFRGPGRRALALRGALAPYLRRGDLAYGAYAAFWLLVFAFTPALDWWPWVLTIAAIVLGAVGLEVVRRQTAREFPDAIATDVWGSLGRRASGLREPRGEPAAAQPAVAAPAAPAAPSIDEQLRRLGELHASGVLTDEEFSGAKSKLLA